MSTVSETALTREAIQKELLSLKIGGATVIGNKSVSRESHDWFHVEGRKTKLSWNQAVEVLYKQKRRKNPSDPYNSAPSKPDPWAQERVKKDRSRKNPSRASVIYAQRKGRKGEVMYFDGKKFTNNSAPKYYGTHDRARGFAQTLVRRYVVLSNYRVWVGPPLPSMRRRNPEGLDEAARRLEDFSGHAVRKTLRVRTRSNQTTGLVVGELDLIGYRTKRAGIAGGKLIRYAHDFSKSSRPLLAVSSDGKQLHIVGGRYEFTEAGIEDR